MYDLSLLFENNKLSYKAQYIKLSIIAKCVEIKF